MEIPQKVGYIIDRLMKNGYEAYAVGGCVRDSLLGRLPGDWDITTSASPAEIKRLFRRTVDTGILHGTVTVMLDKEGFEVTTYRIDGEYEDSRHPKEVMFTTNLLEDLKRRDFTINAMAYNPSAGLVDAFEGIADIKKKQIRCVGKAEERFGEDALRILRAVRFSAQLGFAIEEETKNAAKTLGYTLKNISRERIRCELDKLLMSDNPDFVDELNSLSLVRHIFTQDIIINQQTLRMLKYTPKDRLLRWTAFLEAAGTRENAYAIMRGLKFDNYTTDSVTKLTGWLDLEIVPDKPSVRRTVNMVGGELFPVLAEAKRAFYKSMPDSEQGVAQRLLEELMQTEKLYEEIIADGDCLFLKQLAVGGKDIMNAGLAEGKEIGELLKRLLDIVLESPEKNKKEILLAEAEKYRKNEDGSNC